MASSSPRRSHVRAPKGRRHCGFPVARRYFCSMAIGRTARCVRHLRAERSTRSMWPTLGWSPIRMHKTSARTCPHAKASVRFSLVDYANGSTCPPRSSFPPSTSMGQRSSCRTKRCGLCVAVMVFLQTQLCARILYPGECWAAAIGFSVVTVSPPRSPRSASDPHLIVDTFIYT